MPTSYSPKRMLRILPSQFPVTSRPSVDYTFFSPFDSSIVRKYLFDPVPRQLTSDQGKVLTLLRAADALVDGIYGSAIQVDPATTGDIWNYGTDLDAQVGSSWSLTFTVQPLYDTQPTAASALRVFRNPNGANPSFGYNEQTGTVEALGWYGVTSATTVSLAYALGWQPRKLLTATLISDAVANKSYLWVNGVLQVTLTQAIKANVAGNLTFQRSATQAGTTGPMDLETYFIHNVALSASQVGTLHKMFTTGYTDQSRIVRGFMALGMSFAEIEDFGWNADERNKLALANGGTLTRLGLDYNCPRMAGEPDSSLRGRIGNRLLQISSHGTINEIIAAVAQGLGLSQTQVLLKNEQDENGNYKAASFAVLLPPANGGQLTLLQAILDAMQTAGVRTHTGTVGTFSWDVAGEGWDTGAWFAIR